MTVLESEGMARTRALMTETERRYIAHEDDVSDSRRYQAISRVRSRIGEELETDVAVLRENHPKLLDELREVVCKDMSQRNGGENE